MQFSSAPHSIKNQTAPSWFKQSHLNTPSQTTNKMMFAMPRNEEIFYENNLIRNKKQYWNKNKSVIASKDYNPYHVHGNGSESLNDKTKQLPDLRRNMKSQKVKSRTNLEKAEAVYRYEMSNGGKSGNKTKAQQAELYFEFEKMIAKKYQIKKNMYAKVPYHERNEMLKQMLQDNSALIYPDYGEFSDGIPLIQIIERNLKDVFDEGQNNQKEVKQEKKSRKPELDMGGRRKKIEGGKNKTGPTFDPKNFKGNVQLFRHLAEIQVQKCKQKFEESEAIKNEGKFGTTKLQRDFDIEQQEKYLQKQKHLCDMTKDSSESLGPNYLRFNQADIKNVLASGMKNIVISRLKNMYRNKSQIQSRISVLQQPNPDDHSSSRGGDSPRKEQKLPKQYEQLRFSILSNVREICEDLNVQEHRQKELAQLNRDIYNYEQKNNITNSMIKKIQTEEIKNTFDRSIFNGKWNSAIYSGVNDQYVQKALLDEKEGIDSRNYTAKSSYQDFLRGKTRPKSLKISDLKVQRQLRQGEELGLNRIYDGFAAPKVFKFEQYNRAIEKLRQGKKKCDPTEIVHGQEFKERKAKLKKWLKNRKRYKRAQLRRDQKIGIGPCSECSSDQTVSEASYDSEVDHVQLKEILDIDEQLQLQIDGAVFSSSLPPGKQQLNTPLL